MEKRIYITPYVESIKLDNEISLQLESLNPPDGPDEISNNMPEYLNSDPFKIT